MSEYINLKLQIKEWQSKCLEKEKRLQASQERTKFLTQQNQELQEMLTETTKLNMDLQRHVINFFEQSEDIEAAKHDTQHVTKLSLRGISKKIRLHDTYRTRPLATEGHL
ncbi:uncharacterized protein LOC143378536 [Andrena cerasifolii]|uniref:uncharacterized protein LOC143378536 n=1 Tax=Andrena cerasifolii TaxID=2819439 RepID=UPI0040380981